MKANELIQTLKTAIAQGWAVLIQGSPGVGKSDIVTQAATDAGAELIISHPVVSDPTDYKGLPAIVNGLADFMPYGDLRALMNATKPTVFFLDDIGQAAQSVQAALMQLLLCREINGKKISDHVRFIGATNRRADNAGVAGLITPLLSRFRSTVTLEVDATAWRDWAFKAGMPIELIAYIGLKPNMLNTFDPKKAKDMQPFACPRTVAFLGDWIKQGVTDPETLQGCVGEAFAGEFLGFLSIYKKVANLPQQVALNPQGAAIPDEVDIMFALSAALSYYASEKNIDALGIYSDRIAPEMRTFFWKAATSRNPKLIETNAFTQYGIKHADEIQ